MASSAIDVEIVRELFREYERPLAVDLCFQGFEDELATLPRRYAPPRGRLLIAWDGDEVGGCVALRPLGDALCEMKRLYLRPSLRGKGVGRALAMRVIDEASASAIARCGSTRCRRWRRRRRCIGVWGFARSRRIGTTLCPARPFMSSSCSEAA